MICSLNVKIHELYSSLKKYTCIDPWILEEHYCHSTQSNTKSEAVKYTIYIMLKQIKLIIKLLVVHSLFD